MFSSYSNSYIVEILDHFIMLCNEMTYISWVTQHPLNVFFGFLRILAEKYFCTVFYMTRDSRILSRSGCEEFLAILKNSWQFLSC